MHNIELSHSALAVEENFIRENATGLVDEKDQQESSD